MNRRRFLRTGIACGTITLGAGGFLFVRRSQAQAEIKSRLLDDALPPLAGKDIRELKTLPLRAREEIKRYFHGKCLNVEGFVSHISSNEFAERLGRCKTKDEKEGCFDSAFFSRVAHESEILNQIETIAGETGSELDSAWSAYCGELSAKWNTRIQGHGTALDADELTNRLSGMIRDDLGQAARQPMIGNQRPAVGETIGKVGSSALLLLPLVPFVGLTVGIPVFLLLATKHVWDYTMGQLEDRRGDYQAAISGRLALLGNRVGSEFEREIRLRLTNLHTWQDRSIHETANRLAEERVGLI